MTWTAASAGVTVPRIAMWSSRVEPPLLGASSLSLTRGSVAGRGVSPQALSDEAGGEQDDRGGALPHRLTGRTVAFACLVSVLPPGGVSATVTVTRRRCSARASGAPCALSVTENATVPVAVDFFS